MPRAKYILEHGVAFPPDPFDRFAQERECRGKSLEELLDGFTTLRAQNVAALETLHLCPADLAKKGTHQRLGSVTFAQLLATWAAHDLPHLDQLSRVMAYQYRDAVGPWVEQTLQDARYALRTLLKSPGFTAVALLTLDR